MHAKQLSASGSNFENNIVPTDFFVLATRTRCTATMIAFRSGPTGSSQQLLPFVARNASLTAKVSLSSVLKPAKGLTAGVLTKT
jgi:hypothetical protein